MTADEIAIRRDARGLWRAHYPNGGFSDAHVEAKKAIADGYVHATQLLGWQVVAWKVLGLDEWRMVRRDDQKKSAKDG